METSLFKVIIADDHPHYKAGFCNALATRKDCNIIETVSNGEELIRLARSIKPHLVLTDIIMPVINGIQATRVIKEEQSHIKIIALALYQPERIIEKMLRAGADGYLFKNCSAEIFHQAIDEVMYRSGKYYAINEQGDDKVTSINGLELF